MVIWFPPRRRCARGAFESEDLPLLAGLGLHSSEQPRSSAWDGDLDLTEVESPQPGGCRPRTASSARMARIKGRFNLSVATVVRPVSVSPTTVNAYQRKWSPQRCRRGLNKGTVRPVRGSRPDRRDSFLSEHETQASARLSAVVVPPATLGTMWSM
jgi:hypothetical protein